MELYYCKYSNGIKNFGDDLNPWIWKRLIPDFESIISKFVLIGIGTILNSNINIRYKNKEKIIFSSGYGYGDLPTIDNTWKFLCVRGPLTAKKLGLSRDSAITDGAILLNKLYHGKSNKTHKYSYMPHVSMSIESGDIIKKLTAEIGVNYINPSDDIENVMSEICSTQILITEAMHGAIVAEAFRIPWVAVKTSEFINDFKWHDWCLSVGRTYDPAKMVSIWQRSNVYSTIKLYIKKKVFSSQLSKILNKSHPTLCDDAIFNEKLELLEEKIHELKTLLTMC